MRWVVVRKFLSTKQVVLTLVVVGLLLLRFWPLIFQSKTLIFGDNYSLMVPGKIYTAQWLRQGVLPFWNPYIFAGIPWIEDVNQSVVYFSTLLFVVLQPATALNVTVMLHLVIAFVGMYLWAGRWTKSVPLQILAGVLWMLSTQVTGSVNNLSTLQSLVWLPWLGWAGEQVATSWRMRWAVAGLTLLQFAGGYPQHVIYSLVMAALFSWLTWPVKTRSRLLNWLRVWSLTTGLAIGLSAVIWLPFGEKLLDSTRMLQTSEQAAVGSLNPVMLMKVILPYFFDKPLAGMKWGPAWSGQPNMVFYITWVGLAVLGLRWWQKPDRLDKWLAGISLVTLVFSLGAHIPGFTLVQTLVPFFRIGRYPSMIMIITNAVLILWLVRSLERVTVPARLFKFLFILLIIAGGGAAAGWLLVHLHFDRLWLLADQVAGQRLSQSLFHTLERDRVIAQVISQDLLITVVLAAAAWWSLARKKVWWLVLFLSLDMLYHTQANFFFAPRQVYPTWQEIDQNWQKTLTPTGANSSAENSFIPQNNPQVRWLSRNGNQPYTDFGSYWEALVVRAPFSDSFVDEAEFHSYTHPQRLRAGLTPDWNQVSGIPFIHGYTTLLPQDFAQLWVAGPDSQLTQTQTADEVRINFISHVELDNPLLAEWSVAYYLVDPWFKIAEAEQLSKLKLVAHDQMGNQPFSIYELPSLPRFRYLDNSAPFIGDYQETPNRQQLAIMNFDNQKFLKVADRYDRNWRAEVNGKAVPITDDKGMRVVPLEPENNLIVFRYVPMSFYWGLLISGMTVVGGLGACFLNTKKPPFKWFS